MTKGFAARNAVTAAVLLGPSARHWHTAGYYWVSGWFVGLSLGYITGDMGTMRRMIFTTMQLCNMTWHPDLGSTRLAIMTCFVHSISRTVNVADFPISSGIALAAQSPLYFKSG